MHVDPGCLISFWQGEASATQSGGAVYNKNCIYAGVVTHPPDEFPACDTKQSDGEAPVILTFWGMWSTTSLLSLPVNSGPER